MSSASIDPRVETLVAWAQQRETPVDDRTGAALDALTDAPPAPIAAPALALAAAAAYERVPGRGPRNLQAGHQIVAVLARLGEHGARELVRLRERTRYHHPRRALDRALRRIERELRIPLGELEDAFGGSAVDAALARRIYVGPFEAVVQVNEDLRRVHTTWRGRRGQPLRGRPSGVTHHPEELALLRGERRRLQAHLTDLRSRLEQAMVTGRSWEIEQWAVRMFADPLRAALSRRLVWRFDGDSSSLLAVPQDHGLHDVDGEQVEPPERANVELWHPANDPELQASWLCRVADLGMDQPIDQVSRQVTAADARRLTVVAGARVDQRAFRGFLMRRGWQVPYLGRWFTVPEATRGLMPGGPYAVLHLEPGVDDDGLVMVGELSFRSVPRHELDARALPPAVVSDAARDVLGAVNAASNRPG